jgi:hypothetical protein
LDLAPRDDLDWHRYVVALSEAHRIKYEEDANERDLLRAFELNWKALSAVSPGQSAHTHYACCRCRLLSHKFERFGVERDLYGAAKYGSEALDKPREEDLYRADRMHSLSSVLFKKYYHDQNFDDLEEALQLAEQAISCFAAGSRGNGVSTR